MVCTFALGAQYLYDFIDRNPEVEFHPVDYTNLPHNIMRNDKVVSINNTTQIDLQGQAASETDGFRHISGTGGQLQFVRGAYGSQGREKLHVPGLDLREEGRAAEPDRDGADPGQRGDDAADRHDVCGDRVRDGEPEGAVDGRAGASADFASPTRISARNWSGTPMSTG